MSSLSKVMALFKTMVKQTIQSLIPLSRRQAMAIWVHRQDWISTPRRAWWSTELIRDLSEKDVNAYHKFLWTHHLAYATPYEPNTRFGGENIRPSRLMFFTDLCHHLQEIGVDRKEIHSILDVGCSLGFQLRYMETDLFPSAAVLDGIDIDQYAVLSGKEYLRSVQSKVVLSCGDIQQLDSLLGDRYYDLIICSGVLMYLEETDAAEVVRVMLAHSRALVAMAGLANPRVDNAHLDRSDTRSRDHTFIHNIDQMVKVARGKISARRWEGDRQVDGQTIYFVFAAPQ